MTRPIGLDALAEPVCVGCDNAPRNPANPHGWCSDCAFIAAVRLLHPDCTECKEHAAAEPPR